jgi:ubiquinone/menaquinone biosynthesis C-methylase UbiE
VSAEVQHPAAVSADVHHPVFARFFDRLSRVLERDLGPRRAQLVADLSGRVLEVGAGNGINFRRYPTSVQEVVALEPEPYLRVRAGRAAASAPVAVSVRPGVANPLEFEDQAFDAAVASLVMCSVPDQAAALGELRRVVKPGGELRFLEHVRSERPGKARVQVALDSWRIWPALAGGCHCARDTVSAIEAAGFAVREVQTLNVGPGWGLTNPHVIGMAQAR